jgi:polysaccharide biosynthesis/export protein
VTRSWMKIVCIFLAALCGAAVPGRAQSSPVRSAGAQATQVDQLLQPLQPLRIGNGDLLDITVFDTPELIRKVRVSNDGNILLPLIGVVHVAGMTADQAVMAIRDKLIAGKYVKDPEVSVLISEYATQGVSVLGEVKKPGIYPATGTHRLEDYLSMAEGLTDSAGARVSITHRNAPDSPQIVAISSRLDANPGGNPVIQSGDTIFVPKAGEIFVVGDVVRQGGFLMDHDEHLTIIQAIALAQGAGRAAALDRARILRKTSAGWMEIPVQVKKILDLKAKDVALQDNDILYIPISGVRSSLNRGMDAILQSAVGVASFRTF